MSGQVEHANIKVRDIDETVNFLTTALPNFKVRGGSDEPSKKWVHIGTESTYLALNEDGRGTQKQGPGLNHVGFVVDDTDAVRERLEKAGFKEGYVPEPIPTGDASTTWMAVVQNGNSYNTSQTIRLNATIIRGRLDISIQPIAAPV